VGVEVCARAVDCLYDDRAIGVNDAMRCDAVDAAAAAAAAAAAVATSPPDEINHDLFCRRVSLRAALN